MSRVYLDHNAGAPPLAAAVRAFREAADEGWANPSSAHAEGRWARQRLETAREQVADLAGVPASWVVFTSGGTEAAHAALRGAVGAGPAGGVVVLSGLEHPAIRAAAAALGREGRRIVTVAPDPAGVVRAEAFLAAVGPDTRAAALILAHNEIGTLQPVAKVAEALAGRGLPLVVDAVQGAGRLPAILPPGGHVLGVLSAAKIGGLPGAGALLADPDLLLTPLMGGGEQERGRRGGTPAVALAAAMGAAAAAGPRAGDWARAAALRDRFESELACRCPDLVFIGRREPRLPNTSAFLVPGRHGEDVVAALDMAGVAVSSGSACATGSSTPSASLLAMGHTPESARGLVRVSLGVGTTDTEIEAAVSALDRALTRMERHARPAGGAA